MVTLGGQNQHREDTAELMESWQHCQLEKGLHQSPRSTGGYTRNTWNSMFITWEGLASTTPIWNL